MCPYTAALPVTAPLPCSLTHGVSRGVDLLLAAGLSGGGHPVLMVASRHSPPGLEPQGAGVHAALWAEEGVGSGGHLVTEGAISSPLLQLCRLLFPD